MKRAYVLLLVFVVVLVNAATAEVKNEQKLFKVVVQNGKETLIPDTVAANGSHSVVAKPGDLLEYRLTVQNSDKQTYRNVREDLPIREGMVVVLDTATPKPTEASADGHTFAAFPLTKTSVVNGVSTKEVLPASAYKILRWNIGTLAPGATVEMRVRVRVK